MAKSLVAIIIIIIIIITIKIIIKRNVFYIKSGGKLKCSKLIYLFTYLFIYLFIIFFEPQVSS